MNMDEFDKLLDGAGVVTPQAPAPERDDFDRLLERAAPEQAAPAAAPQPAPEEKPPPSPQEYRLAARLEEARNAVYDDPQHPVHSAFTDPRRLQEIAAQKSAALREPDADWRAPDTDFQIIAKWEMERQRTEGKEPSRGERTDPKKLRQEAMRAQAEKAMEGEEGNVEWWARNVGEATPGGLLVVKKRAANARKRIEEGSEDFEDFLAVARMERLEGSRQQQHSTWGGTFRALPFQLGAMGLEMAAAAPLAAGAGLARAVPAGASLLARAGVGAANAAAAVPFMPSTYTRGVERNIEADRALLDPRGIAAQTASSVVHMAILGGAGGAARTGAPLFSREGLAELGKAGINTAAAMSAGQAVTGAMGLDAGYGALVDLAQGKFGDGAKKLAVDALTGAFFHAIHGKGVNPADELAAKFKDMRRRGFPPDAAAERLTQQLGPMGPVGPEVQAGATGPGPQGPAGPMLPGGGRPAGPPRETPMGPMGPTGQPAPRAEPPPAPEAPPADPRPVPAPRGFEAGDSPADTPADIPAARVGTRGYHRHPAQERVADQIGAWTHNDGGQHWTAYPEPRATPEGLRLDEAVARDPLPLPKGGEEAAPQLQRAWDLVSRLWPEAAAQVKSVRVQEVPNPRVRAALSEKGVLIIPKNGKEVRPDTLWHEFIHIDQRSREGHKGVKDRSDAEHIEYEREAHARAAQMSHAKVWEQLEAGLAARPKPAPGPLEGIPEPALAEMAKGVGLSAKALRAQADQPWVRQMAEAWKAQQGGTPRAQVVEPERPPEAPAPEAAPAAEQRTEAPEVSPPPTAPREAAPEPAREVTPTSEATSAAERGLAELIAREQHVGRWPQGKVAAEEVDPGEFLSLEGVTTQNIGRFVEGNPDMGALVRHVMSGGHVDPVVVVRRPGGRRDILDGEHRLLALGLARRKARALVINEDAQLPAPDAAPARPSFTERMRARQQPDVQAPPPPARPARPEAPAPAPEAPSEFARAGLTPIEEYVYAEMRQGRTTREVAKDPELARLYGKAPSHQTVVNIGKRAQAKLGTEGSVYEVSKAEEAVRRIEDGETTGAEDLHGDPEADQHARRRLDGISKAEAEFAKLEDAWSKEVERAKRKGQQLSPERQAFYEAELGRLDAVIQGRPPGAEGAADEVPGGVGEKAPLTPEQRQRRLVEGKYPDVFAKAREAGIDAEAVHDAYGDMWKEEQRLVEPHNALYRDAMDALSGAGTLRAEMLKAAKAEGREGLTKGQEAQLRGVLGGFRRRVLSAEDVDAVKGLDDVASALGEARVREVATGREQRASAEEILFRVLKDGIRKPSAEKAYNDALDRLVEMGYRATKDEVGDVNRELQRVGEAPATPEDIARLEEEARREVQEAEGDPASADTSFDFGANAPAVEPPEPLHAGIPLPSWLTHSKAPVPEPAVKVSGTRIPRFQDYAEEKVLASNPRGLGLAGGLGKLTDPRARESGPVGEAIITRAAQRSKGEAFAALEVQKQKAKYDGLFPVEGGTVGLTDGTRGYLSDVIEAEMRAKGSQKITPEQRAWIWGEWVPILKDAVRMRRAEGMKTLTDPTTGKVLPLADVISKGYFPRQAVGKGTVPRDATDPAGHYTRRPGSKVSSEQSRYYETEKAGATGSQKMEYDPDFISRVGKFMAGEYLAVADHRLAHDPALGGKRGHTVWGVEERSPFGPAFEGKVYPKETIELLQRAYGQGSNAWVKAMEKGSAVAKAAVLTMDMSAPFTQGLPVMAASPTAWARATAGAYKALADPKHLGRVLQQPDNARAAAELVQAGSSIGRLQDFLAGTEKGTLGKLPLMPKPVGQALDATVGRALEATGRAHGAFMDLAKIELWKAYRDRVTPEQHGALAEYIDNLVGYGRMEERGITPSAATAERLALLAPSFYRSALDLYSTALLRGDKVGDFARRDLMKLAGGVTLLSVGGMLAVGLSWDEIADRLKPWKSKFLKVPVKMGEDTVEVGAGHPLVSLLRLVFQGAASLFSKNPVDTGSEGDPFMRWYRGHAAAGPSLFADAMTGTDFLGRRQPLTKAVASKFEPLVVQSLLHGDGTPGQSVGSALFGFLGLQAYPQGQGAKFFGQLDTEGKRQFGRPYNDLSLHEQAKVVREVNKTKPPSPEFTPEMAKRAEAARQERVAELTSALSPESRKTLDALGKKLPAYHNTVKMGDVDVPLSRGQAEKYRALLAEEYDGAVKKWNVGALRSGSAKWREKYIENQLKAAKERATNRLRKEYVRPKAAAS